MVIRQQMIRVCSSYCMFLVILICASSVGSLENRKRTEDVSLSQLVDPVTGKVDEGMAELLWISCRLDLLCLKEAKKDLNFCYPEETSDMASGSNSDGRLLTKRRLWKMIKVQNPQLKQTLLDCMRKNNIVLHVSGQSGSSFQRTRYLDSILPMPTVPKRNLLQSNAEVPAPALVPADGSPFLSPVPSPDLSPSPASAPSPVPTASPVPTPSPVPTLSPVSAPPPRRPFFPQPGDRSPPLLPPFAEDGSAASASGPSVEPGSHRHNRKVIIIAVAVTAAVTFVFAALFFFCCTKICQKRSRGGRNDEKPLLGVSLTDYSTGSPRNHKSFGLVNTNNEEKADHQSITKNSSHQRKDSSLDNVMSDSLHASSDEIALSAESFSKYSNTIAQVPSPGRVDNLLPLKPPPGRAVPLPPEPPASLRPPTRKAHPPPPPSPPPPAPCAPPLPPPKASGSVGPGPPGPPPPPPMAPGAKARPSPPPPPPPKAGPAPPQPPPPLPMGSKVPRPPTGLKHPPNPATGEGDGADGEANTSKAKLKPFFWDKVLANPDHSMVWHQIKSGSFQFNEEMIETLFGYAPADRSKTGHKKDSSSQDPTSHFIQILDTKKAQNLSILLRALNVTTEEVCDALHEGNELPVELLQTLLKMAPTADEELKLRLYTGELSELGNAERFLKALVDIPFAYKRLEALLFMCTLREDVGITKESFETLEIACKELRNSRLFLKLLEAVLKTGNRMNDGTYRGGAQAFKLDTLLKLSDVRGKDGKTTLLHFVVQEIIRSEGAKVARAARESQTLSNISVKTDDLHEGITPDTEHDYGKLGLQVVSRLSSELENVKKAANIDSDSLTGTVAKLGFSLLGTQEFLTKDMNSLGEESKFHETLKSFVQNAEVDIMWLLEEEKRIMALVKSTGDYFHGKAGKDEGLRLFVIVRDFLIILDKVCKQVEEAQKKAERSQKKESSSAPSHSSSNQQLSPDFRPRLFPAIPEQDFETSSSDGETE